MSDTPRTDAIMALVRKISDYLPYEQRVALREGAENGIAELERELAEARRDAARYRWLRECPNTKDWARLGDMWPNQLDAAIDAAMGEK